MDISWIGTQQRQWITVFVLAVITVIVIWIINHVFRTIYKRRNRLNLKFLHSLINVLIIVTALYACLTQFEVTKEVSTTILKSGTLIIAILTFAAQKALANVIAGFSISASRPCDVGERIRILTNGNLIAEGLVLDMTLRHIVLEQEDGARCIVPNSVVDNAVIIGDRYVSPHL